MPSCSRSSRLSLLPVVVVLAVVVGLMMILGRDPSSEPLLHRKSQNYRAEYSQQSLIVSRSPPWNNAVNQSRVPLQFFNEEVIRSPEEILNSSWLKRLQHLLRTVSIAGEAAIIFANYGYIESLLNWLVVAQVKVEPPILNVIVVCLDEEVFRILDERDIPSIHISPHEVTRNTSVLRENTFAKTIWVMRFAIYRLINYLGYDVVSYDTDAIVMKNPQPIFEKYRNSDIVSSAGSFPFSLGRKWGFTMCMGVIMFRSTPKTEKLWNSIHTNKLDDQVMLNSALQECGVSWSSDGKNIQNDPISGVCEGSGLRVTVLPFRFICRKDCARILRMKESKSELYVWHPLVGKVGKRKSMAAKNADVWFLNWNKTADGSVSGNLKGTEWLTSLLPT